uniref:Uncharacterized protein n=1 Tax=Aegilops tauschii TaxID=37682 RepID=M8CKE7_AEGTA
MAALLTRSIAVLGLVLCATTVAESFNIPVMFHDMWFRRSIARSSFQEKAASPSTAPSKPPVPAPTSRGALFCQLRASARAGVVSHGRCSGSARAADRSAGSCSVDARFRTEIQRAIADAHASHYASSRFATTCIGTTQTWSSAPVAADPSARRHAARCHQLSVSCVNAGDLPDRPAGCFCR